MDTDLALLVLRLVVGALVAAHGAQKLFGAFGGGGLGGTAAFLAGLGLRPARLWALLAGLAEFGGGALVLLGLLYPLAPVGVLAVMAMAVATVHWGKPIWADRGGAELPLTNAAAATALILAGPGAYALDPAVGFGILLWFAFPLVGSAVVFAVVLLTRGPSYTGTAREASPAEEARRAT